MAREYPKRFYRYVDGAFEDSKEAKDEATEKKLIARGYIQKVAPTEYPKVVYKAEGGKLASKIVKDRTADEAAAKAGFGALPTQAEIDESKNAAEPETDGAGESEAPRKKGKGRRTE